MASIRRWGVVAGGAVAGVLLVCGGLAIGYFVLMPELAQLPADAGPPGLVTPLLAQFLAGFVVVWVYVGFRPRFGAGRRSVVAASAAVWFVRSAAVVSYSALSPLFSPLTVALVVVWSLIELTAACFAGASVYRRHSAAVTRKRGSRVDVDVVPG